MDLKEKVIGRKSMKGTGMSLTGFRKRRCRDERFGVLFNDVSLESKAIIVQAEYGQKCLKVVWK